MPNPVIAEVTRGGIVESRHTGAYVVMNRDGAIIASGGDISAAIFPRSAIKAFQFLPVIERGAADHFGFTGEEIALGCSSHSGEPEHVRVARAMLTKADNDESLYECGAHWPSDKNSARELERPLQIHNNCSGKHAGMLALARHLGVDPKGYVNPGHPVQRAVNRTISQICDCDLDQQPCGIDGCSVPTWAMPLSAMAFGFARLPNSAAGKRIIAAARAHPFMIAGTGRFDTKLMTAIPRIFSKTGAEGVYCACIPHAELGVALKCDDGATRAAEVALAGILGRLDVWTAEERKLLEGFKRHDLVNWRKLVIGEVRVAIFE